ncbi:MAG: beta-galactosidase [Prevotellaceae bacterium]|jgi:hypothetical protein|nr:beta-galactosidase [Prevotellaceae bacterium]
MKALPTLFFALALAGAAFAQRTEVQYLSGTGLGAEKTWKFRCSGGMNSGKWGKINVPSQWELQGYGEYTYGRWYTRGLKNPSMETGEYEYDFTAPKAWEGKSVSIVFEGVMTDAEVKINGASAGEIHQGGFYEFSYDITDKLKFGARNKLEVKVWKHSANRSVNAAERRADWWLFGGIYRPVYLAAKPKVHIMRAAVDARADGTLQLELFTTPLPENYSLTASIAEAHSRAPLQTKTVSLKSGVENQIAGATFENVKAWTNETPNLYCLTLNLLDENSQTVHSHTEKIGFRTVEFRRNDGLYVNGVRVVLKGINRHSFYPDGGRTLNREINLKDAELIREMNINAVRSHYPPDKSFLDACDSLGLFYLDELAGWQNSYDEATGAKLVKEMIARDVNHPCIVIWDNGNEGGWSYAVDKYFALYDPQKRHLIHPWADFNDFDTHHYPEYQTGIARFNNGFKVFMPAETMHAMYDQGGGAGLEDFWEKWSKSPLFAGAFIWAYVDEAVKRSDKNGALDSDGSNAPDGVVGPYRQREGSFYTIREVWSPIKLHTAMVTPSFTGELLLENKYLFSSLKGSKLKYRLKSVISPLGRAENLAPKEGDIILPDIEPNEARNVKIPVTKDFFLYDVLEVEAYSPNDRLVCSWTLPIHRAEEYFRQQVALRRAAPALPAASVQVGGGAATLAANGVKITFDTATSMVTDVENSKGKISFRSGPVAVGLKMEVRECRWRSEGGNAVLTFFYKGGVDSIRWEMTPAGMLGFSAVMLNNARAGAGFDDAVSMRNITSFGFTFSYPEAAVKGMRWLGRGPYRVWKNRIKGTSYGLWEKAYNNTVTGEDYENLVYPEFKGYHANLYWATLQTLEGDFTVYSESNGLFFRVLTPQEPKGRVGGEKGENTMPAFPAGDLSFLYEIPAIRSFKPTWQQGPSSQPATIRIKAGDEGIKMKLWFDFSNISS